MAVRLSVEEIEQIRQEIGTGHHSERILPPATPAETRSHELHLDRILHHAETVIIEGKS
ncbi:MAG: hypothetical protein ABSH20_07580 [Tepidisphaeraceae bacterium]